MLKEKLSCLSYFSFDFLGERPGVKPDRERSQSCSFLEPESSDKEIKDRLLKVNAKSVCLQSRRAVRWVLNTDREFKAVSWTLQNKKVMRSITSKLNSNI